VRLKILSWDGHAINDGQAFNAWIPSGALDQVEVETLFVERYATTPFYAGKRFGEFTFPLVVELLGDVFAQSDVLKQWFRTFDLDLKRLRVMDTQTGEVYYRWATPRKYTTKNGRATILMAASDPVWHSETVRQAAWSLSGVGGEAQRLRVLCSGNEFARPRFTVLSLGQGGSSGDAVQRFVRVYNRGDLACESYALDLTDGGLDTAALVTAGLMRSDGHDLRVWVDGVQVPRWLVNVNTSQTRVWISRLSLRPRVEFALGQAILDSGVVGEIQCAKTAAKTLARLAGYASSGMLEIGGEIFTYAGIDLKTLKLGGVQRAAKNTRAAAHDVGTICRWLEHEIWVTYGDPSAGDPAADDPDYDRYKPAFDLASSTNTSWVYAGGFGDAAGQRPGSWKAALLSSTGKLSETTSGVQGADGDDPALRLGMRMLAGASGSETARLEWRLYQPAGIASVACSGEKRRTAAAFPQTAALQSSKNGTSWVIVWNETLPVNSGQWTAFSRGAVALSAAPTSLRFYFDGKLSGVANAQANFEIASCTVNLNAGGVPFVSLAEDTDPETPEHNSSTLRARISNVSTGEYLELDARVLVGKALVIDTDAKTVMHDGTSLGSAVRFSSVRTEWLALAPGAYPQPGENVLQFDAEVSAEVTITVEWEDRML